MNKQKVSGRHRKRKMGLKIFVFVATLVGALGSSANAEPMSMATQINPCFNIPVVLDEKIVGLELHGQQEVKAHIEKDVVEDGKLRIPANSRVGGNIVRSTLTSPKFEQYYMNFDRLELKDGPTLRINAIPPLAHVEMQIERNKHEVRYYASRLSGQAVPKDCPLTGSVIALSVVPRKKEILLLEPGDKFNIQLEQTVLLPSPTK